MDAVGPYPIILANSVTNSHPEIFQLTLAFILLSVQFSHDLHPFYVGSTNVNHHFHLTYNTM
jgi:hypothetical protein